MYKELKQLILELLKHETVVISWGITKINIGKKSISFHVSAFKYNGRVQIKCLKGGYSVKVGPNIIKGLALSDIVETIDCEIETSTDYYEKIARWITNQNKSFVKRTRY